MLWVLLGLLSYLTFSIRFNYNLPKYQIQCFHESVEKDSRYQIQVKGETSTYYLHVVDSRPLLEDSRIEGAELKSYSAFADRNEVLTFCVGNLGSSDIYFDIQFYHGIYLQDSFESESRGRELEDLSDRWIQMLRMVQSNYAIYRGYLLERKSTGQRISIVLGIMVAIIVLSAVGLKLCYYHKMVGFLKEKKAV